MRVVFNANETDQASAHAFYAAVAAEFERTAAAARAMASAASKEQPKKQ